MIRQSLLLVLLAAGCASGVTLKREVEAIQSQLDRSWANGGYRCAPRDLALAEAELVFVRTELDQGNAVRAAKHRTAARSAMQNVLDRMKSCPGLIPDSDGDGLIDTVDRCPGLPEDFDGHDDGDGCPEKEDRDGDGVFDDEDGCPDEPGAFENKGCPYGDSDGDGLNDDKDACPKAKEDVDGFEDADGCPDPDNDKDGVPDGPDRCPMQPETMNGFEDADGCPDVNTELVKVNRDIGKIEIKQKVYFSTGRALIRQRSNRLLDEVAEVLKANPTMTVLVEGHTDSVGSTTNNLRLSQQRADSVRDYLIAQGVEPERLTAIGFGEEKPIDSNRTRLGRERNRRVEFTLTTQ